MATWFHWLLRRKRDTMDEGAQGVVPLADAFEESPGKWLAVDRATGIVKAIAETPDQLTAYLRDHGIAGVAVVRAPDQDEPELVGLG